MKKHFVVQYLLIFLVLLGCNKAPALLEATQTDFTWQTVQITAKGAIAQVARVNLASVEHVGAFVGKTKSEGSVIKPAPIMP